MCEVENSEDTFLYFHGAYNVYMLYVLVYRLPFTYLCIYPYTRFYNVHTIYHLPPYRLPYTPYLSTIVFCCLDLPYAAVFFYALFVHFSLTTTIHDFVAPCLFFFLFLLMNRNVY
jgi:hypothetical protein